jgi:hypothetical protein
MTEFEPISELSILQESTQESLLDLCPYETFTLPETITEESQQEFMQKIDQAYETSRNQNHEGIMVKFPQLHSYTPNNRLHWLKVLFFVSNNSSNTNLERRMNH